MIKMEIRITDGSYTCITCTGNTQIGTELIFPDIRSNKYRIEYIQWGQDHKTPEMALAHEIAHILIIIKRKRIVNPETDTDTRVIREELMAWRLAKTFCKRKYWDDEQALKSFLTYVDNPKTEKSIKKRMKKIGIIPWYGKI